MDGKIVLCVLNAKYIHASPSVWCLSAGIKAYAAELYDRLRIVEGTINQPPNQTLQKIVSHSPIVVGFSCYLWNIKITLKLCKDLKKIYPDIIIMLGGPEVSYCAKNVLLENPQVDYILSGEGEESVPAFLKAIFSKKAAKPLQEPAKQYISGLCGRRDDGTVFDDKPCTLNTSVPSPLTAGYAEATQGRITYFESSRGCPFSCAFCLSGRCGTPRYFDLEIVFKDLLRLANSGTKTIKFVDRTFNANPAHANKILEFILYNYGKDIPYGVSFHFEIAGDILKEETFNLLSKMPAGAIQLEIGMQSFCEKTLEAVHRKTNTKVLIDNINRLVSMGNIHIHIDLIAGLPHESYTIFAESFNIGYALKAQMLQIGFLKLLHGSTMRSEPQNYPCKYDINPPYEVISTPWLSANELQMLHNMEDAVERVYNSGRFNLTAEYVIKVTGKTPFEFYSELGNSAYNYGISQNISLDDYTAFFQSYCSNLKGVDKKLLRDMLVRDRLSTNATGFIPKCIYIKDQNLSKAIKRLKTNPLTAPKKGIRRGIALLYSTNSVCWADYIPEDKNPVTGRWILSEIPLKDILHNI